MCQRVLTGLEDLLNEDGKMETTKMISLVENLHVIYTNEQSGAFHSYIITNTDDNTKLRDIGVLIHRLVKRDSLLENK